MSLIYSVVYFGTPEFAIPALKMLVGRKNIKISAVVTQPDRPKGRGGKLTASPVKEFALKVGLPVFQPEKLRSEELEQLILKLQKPDLGVCVAYGNILPRKLLDLPKHGIVNIHASLLPRWRGAAPIQHAILEGDSETGVCIMQLAEGLDTGDVYARSRVAINKTDNYSSIHDKLSKLGAELLDETLEGILDGTLKAEKQSESGVTYAHKWVVGDLIIDFRESAEKCFRRILASTSYPGARTILKKSENEEGVFIKIFSARIERDKNYSPKLVGEIVNVSSEALVVSCGDGTYLGITELQLAGKKRMEVSSLLKGYQITTGSFFC